MESDVVDPSGDIEHFGGQDGLSPIVFELAAAAMDSNGDQSVQADDEAQPRGFLKLPPEIRIKIYEYLLLPPLVTRVECSNSPAINKECTPGGRLLASTCKPVLSTIRTLHCSRCEFRGADVHASILGVNSKIYQEAMPVLYENARVVIRCIEQPPTLRRFSVALDLHYQAVRHIRHFQLSLNTAESFMCEPSESADQDSACSELLSTFASVTYSNLPLLEHVTIHFDIDLTLRNSLDAKPFAAFATFFGDVDYVVEVHIVRAWDSDDDEWAEMIESRPRDEKWAQHLDEEAEHIRAKFVQDLGEIFKAHGYKLKIRDG